ncbi:hypothetical protein QO003_003371 [Arthrobacter silviterrae]|uniref:Sce7726 family protein n=1 Tax=Arthrobacter silviterrae TaxID=2026658 RepID=A0ABX0DIM2_9MICC|nr:sce7726 family protein [Arthrobacter silviterrae]MDQ0279068.1 hypothetical protein [Arthrobacter silviterrae]NGN84485.1 sce7726 family protein [Arthrobacter silviterrae]
MNYDNKRLAAASKLLGSAHLRKVGRVGRLASINDSPILRGVGLMGENETIGEALLALESILKLNYRIETIYKNQLIRKKVLGKKASKESNALLEVRINNSIADVVILGTTVEAYEIKTKFDSPERLSKQLDDYYLAFSRVSVVCDESKIDTYLRHVDDSPTGLIALTKRGALKTIKQSVPQYDRLHIPTMMTMMRQSEYMAIIHEEFGPQPPQPNMVQYGYYLGKAKAIPPQDYAKRMEKLLTRRQPSELERINDRQYKPLISSLFRVNPTADQFGKIQEWLNDRGPK